jgi:1,6-anhydro-N-acetylmuramate kinase
VCVLNIGGISNLSVLGSDGGVIGFDCGPGNALMDHWCQRHTGRLFDQDGLWAASGQVIEPLLRALLSEPYLDLPPPKSTGRDLFNPDWLQGRLAGFAAAAPADVQATLLEFTAQACAADLATPCGAKSGPDRLRRWCIEHHADATPAIGPAHCQGNLIGAAGIAPASGGSRRLCLAGAQGDAPRNR